MEYECKRKLNRGGRKYESPQLVEVEDKEEAETLIRYGFIKNKPKKRSKKLETKAK
jgi:hypothetical protein